MSSDGASVSDGSESSPRVQQFSFCEVLQREIYARSVLPSHWHGQLPVDEKEPFSANLPVATEGQMAAAQNQALQARYYEHQILYRDVSRTCRMCRAGLETVDHVVAGCSAMAFTIRLPPPSTGIWSSFSGSI